MFTSMKTDNVFWSKFRAKYPHASKTGFHLDNTDGVRNIYYGDHWAWGETKHDRSAFSKDEISALGRMSTFPRELVLTKNRYSVPGISFASSAKDIAGELVNLDIFVTPTDSFRAKMRNIFVKTVVLFTSASQANAWLHAPNWRY